MGGATWDLEGRHVFYTTPDEAWRPNKIWRHELGTPVSDDVLVLNPGRVGTVDRLEAPQQQVPVVGVD